MGIKLRPNSEMSTVSFPRISRIGEAGGDPGDSGGIIIGPQVGTGRRRSNWSVFLSIVSPTHENATSMKIVGVRFQRCNALDELLTLSLFVITVKSFSKRKMFKIPYR